MDRALPPRAHYNTSIIRGMFALHGITLLDRDPLYRGGFTDIFQALYRGEEVSLKRLRTFYHQRDQDNHGLRQRLTSEARLWHKLKHPNVLQFLGIDYETFPSDVCIVTPWMRHGTILQYRKAFGASNINIDKRLLEICLGINYLHSEGILHGDIRGTNILINSDGSACLADFGLAEFMETLDNISISHYQGSTRWLAPELIHPDDFALDTFRRSPATDVYAFAYICLEVYTGKLPFIEVANDAEVIYQVIQGGRPGRPTSYDDPGVSIPDDLWNLIQQCWEHQPSGRISVTEVVQVISAWHEAWDNSTIRSVEDSIAQWIFSNQGYYLCWIENSSRARTTYISRTIAELCARERRLAGSFFFTSTTRPIEFFPALIEQIARQFPACESYIRAAIRDEPSLLSPTSADELRDLLLKAIIYPMMTLVETIPAKILVVDTLDLCPEPSPADDPWLTVETLMQALIWLAESMHRNQIPLQIFGTSHPELHRKARRGIPKFIPETRSLYLHPRGLLDSWTDAWNELKYLTRHITPPEATSDVLIEFLAPEGLLSHIFNWLEGNGGSNVCWLKYPLRQFGQKSSIAEHVTGLCERAGSLAAMICCSDDQVNSQTFLPYLALQIGQSMPTVKATMQHIIEDEREVLLTTDDHAFARKLIVEPFLTGNFNRIAPMTVVIDCNGWLGGDFLLDTLIWLEDAIANHALPLQMFITSEPDLYKQVNLQHPTFLDKALTLHLPRVESWAATPNSPTLFLFMNHGQKIYQKLASLLETKISAEHSDDQRLCTSFQAYLDHMVQLDAIESLVESHRCRLQLLQFATQMQISEHPSIREAVLADENAIAATLEGVLNSDADTEVILSLRGDHAHSFLNLLQIVISKGQLNAYEVGRKARRLLVKLSEKSEIIPATVLIRGLTLVDNQPVSGGGFADIYRAVYRGQEVAVKHLRVRQDQDSQRIRRAFGREALVWQQLKHPNVLPFLGIDSEVFPSSLCMVSPWMRHGTILDLRAENGPLNINIEKRLIEIAEGLEYLHAEGVVHGDLRGANILADNDWHAVLSDFGLTVFDDATVATHTSNPHGSVRWMAPELLNPEIFDMVRFVKTQASDVYAFACVCLELYTGHHPFVEAANDAAVIYRVMMGRRPGLRSQAPEEPLGVNMPDRVVEVVEWCWKHQPVERPAIMDVVQIMKTWDSIMSD